MEALSSWGLCSGRLDLGNGVCKEPPFTNFDHPPLRKEGHRNQKCVISLTWALQFMQREDKFPLGARILGFRGNQSSFILPALL